MTDAMLNQRLPLLDLDRHPQAPVNAAKSHSVATGSRVTLNFSLTLADSNSGDSAVVDSNFDRDPVSFTMGDGNLLPGFERVLLGKSVGDRVEVVVPAAEAFGLVNPDNQQRFPRYTFPPDLALSENLLIEFADVSGYKQAGRVTHIGLHDVEIDFNHPLAGRDILFTALIHRIEASNEIAA